jgi:hypothetical protein
VEVKCSASMSKACKCPLVQQRTPDDRARGRFLSLLPFRRSSVAQLWFSAVCTGGLDGMPSAHCQLVAAECAHLLSNNDAGLWKQTRAESVNYPATQAGHPRP